MSDPRFRRSLALQPLTVEDWKAVHFFMTNVYVPFMEGIAARAWKRAKEAKARRAEHEDGMRYTYLGDRMTCPDLRGLQCDPVLRDDGKCVLSTRMASSLVEDASGTRYVVARRMLRRNDKLRGAA